MAKLSVEKAEKMYKHKTELLVAAAEKTPEKIQPYMIKAAPVFAVVMTVIEMILPFVMVIYKYCLKAWKWLEPYHPEDMVSVFCGLFMAFFGGHFPALITAIEAYRQMGFDATWRALKVLYGDLEKVQEESKKDDLKDEDHDGIPDVDQIDASEFVERKVLLFMRTTDPAAVSDAIAAIAAGWVSVIAALKIKFAKAITLGAAIGDVLRKPAQRYFAPPLKHLVPEDYHKWILPGINYAVKFIAVTVAWTIQSVISAFYSAFRGGAIAAKGTLTYLNKYGFINIQEHDTALDELAGYIIAAIGFFIQFTAGFSLPFPLNIFFLPFRITETLIVWCIMD